MNGTAQTIAPSLYAWGLLALAAVGTVTDMGLAAIRWVRKHDGL